MCAQGRRDGATITRKVTCFAVPQWGAEHLGKKVQAPLWHVDESKVSRLLSCKFYGRAGPEAIRMDNLKTSDYPLVDWKGRLLSPTHLDEFKPT